MTIAGLLDTFKGFFSRAFWFGAFLPVTIVAILHALIAAVLFPDYARQAFAKLTGETPVALPYVFASLVILAYILDPLSSFIGGWLDGSLMPERLHNWLRNRRGARWKQLVDAYRALIVADQHVTSLRFYLVRTLAEQRATGNAQAGTDAAAITNAGAALTTAEMEAGTQWNQRSGSGAGPIDTAALEAAGSALGQALQTNPTPEGSPLVPMHRRMSDLLRRAAFEITHRLEAFIRRYPTVDVHDWQATRLGDIRRSYERYPSDAYGATFTYLWPRIRATLPSADDGFVAQITDAGARTNFALLLLVLLVSIPAAWLPLCLSHDAPRWLFLTIGLGSPLTLAFAYQLVLRSEIAFGQITRAAFDRYRLSVLPTLHVALPVDLSAERNLWRRLETIDQRDAGVDIVYRHPPGGGA